LKKINVLGPRAVNELDVAGYGWSGPEKSWTVPSLQWATFRKLESCMGKSDYVRPCTKFKNKQNVL